MNIFAIVPNGILCVKDEYDDNKFIDIRGGDSYYFNTVNYLMSSVRVNEGYSSAPTISNQVLEDTYNAFIAHQISWDTLYETFQIICWGALTGHIETCEDKLSFMINKFLEFDGLDQLSIILNPDNAEKSIENAVKLAIKMGIVEDPIKDVQ